MIGDSSLLLLIFLTCLLAVVIAIQSFFIGPKIGWSLTSHNTILSSLFFLQFCAYPWYSRYLNLLADNREINWYERNITDGIILSLVIIFYILYATFAIGLRGLRFKNPINCRKMVVLEFNEKSILFLYVLIYGLCLILFVNFFISLGGVEAFILILGSYRAGQVQGTGIYTMPILVFCPVLAIYVIDYIRVHGDNGVAILLICISVCIPPLLIGFRVYVAIFLMQVLYIYRNQIMQHKMKFFMFSFMIFIGFGLYSSAREILEAGEIISGDSTDEYLKRLEPLFRSKSIEMIATTMSCNCSAENPFGFLFDPVNVWYNKFVKQDYFSYSDQFAKDVISGGYALNNYGGVNPNFIGFFYWLFGMWGIIVALVIFILLNIYLVSVRPILQGDANVLAAIIYSIIPVLFDTPMGAYNTFFQLFFCLLIIRLIFPLKRNL